MSFTIGAPWDEFDRVAVNLPRAPEQAGNVRILDSNGEPILTTENGAMSVSQDTILFSEQVDGNNLNTNKWTTSVSTLAIMQSSGYIVLNGTGVTTANAYAILTSIKYIPMYSYLPLRVTFNIATANVPENLMTMEVGVGTAATNAAPTDGCFFRWNSSGEFKCVINNAGAEVQSVAITAPTQFDATLFEIVIVEDIVQFFIDDALVAEVEVPTGNPFPTNSGRLPLFARVYNGSSAPAAGPILYIGQVIAAQEGAIQNRQWSEYLASMGGCCYQSPLTPFGQLANHANSTSPSSATLSNTAAGYTTPGGRWQFGAVNGAATDFALFAYQVPTGYQLFVKGINITAVVTGIAVVSATILDWSVGVNASAVSLATADGAGTWAPRRMSLGVQAFPALAGIGQDARIIDQTFDPPLVVDGGRFLHIILQVPVGANTATLVFRGDATVKGFFE